METLHRSAIYPCNRLHDRPPIHARNVRLQFCMKTPPNQTNSTRPRWLLEKGRVAEAEKSLSWLRGQESNPAAVSTELTIIKENIELHKATSISSWRVLFTDPDLFKRLWRVALLMFMAQMCGATAMKYYLPSNFIALGLGKQMALMASGIEGSLKVGCTIIEMLIIDKAGRKTTLILGSSIMAIALLVRSPPLKSQEISILHPTF